MSEGPVFAETMTDHLLWWGGVSMFPLLAMQGMKVRRSLLRLPPASPPYFGTISSDKTSNFQLYVVGESSAAGVGAVTHANALGGQLAQKLRIALDTNVTWRAIGQHGIKANTLRHKVIPATLIPALHENRADLIVITIGVNDAKGVTPRRQWREDMTGLLSDIRRYSCAPVILSGIPPMHQFSAIPEPLATVLGARSRLLDRDLASIAHLKSHVTYLPFEQHLNNQVLAKDGFHPSEQGYKMWAENITKQYVTSAKKISTSSLEPIDTTS